MSKALDTFLQRTSRALNQRRHIETIKKEGISSEEQTIWAAVTKWFKGVTKSMAKRGWIKEEQLKQVDQALEGSIKMHYISQVSMTKDDALFEELKEFMETIFKEKDDAQNFKTYGNDENPDWADSIPQFVLKNQKEQRDAALKALVSEREGILSRIHAREELQRTGGYTVWRRIWMIVVSILLVVLCAYSTVQVMMVFLAAVTRRPMFLSAYPPNRTVSWRYHTTGVILLFVVWLLTSLLPGIYFKNHSVMVFMRCLIPLIRRDDMMMV